MTSLKEIADALGYKIDKDEDFNISSFLTHIKKAYVHRDTAHTDDELVGKVTGTRMGKLSSKLAKALDLSDNAAREKKVEELVDEVITTYAAKLKAAQDGGAGNNEDTAKLQQQLTDAQTELQTAQEEVKTWKQKHKADTEQLNTNLLHYKINTKRNEVFGSLKFSRLVTPLLRTGFMAAIDQQFDFDLDENDELLVYKKGTKKPVESKTQQGQHATVLEVLTDIADAENLLEKTAVEIKKPVLPFITGDKEQPRKQPHGKAQKHLENLQTKK